MDTKNFHVTIKGLVFDADGRMLFLQEKDKTWDLPGGRLEHGETFQEGFLRECQEEMGVEGTLIEEKPVWIWTIKDINCTWRIVLCFKAKLSGFEFKQSDECMDHGFFDKDEISKLDLRVQTKELLRFL